MKKTILFVPGFRCDTYTSIEHMSILLSKHLEKEFNIVWLVPNIQCDINRFKDIENKYKLTEPLYVTHLVNQKIKFITIDFSKFNLIHNFILFQNIFREIEPGYVFTQYGIERFYTALISKIYRKHVIWYEHWNSLGTKFIWAKNIFYQLFIDDFIAVSDFIAETLPKNKHIHVVSNALEVKLPPKIDKDEIKQKLQLSQFDSIILMIAAFRSDKRHDIAINIANNVLTQISGTNVGFVFLGSGGTYDNCKKEINKRGLDSNLKMPGHVKNVDEYLLVSDIHYLTSPNEPFGICHLEAMNYKLPVLAFESMSSKSIIQNGINGYLVPFPDDKKFALHIIELIKNRESKKKLGEAGYQILVKDFSMEAWMTNMSAVFHRVTSNKT